MMAKNDQSADREDIMVKLFSTIAESLNRIADAQETIAAIMKADLTEQVEVSAQDRAVELAGEMFEAKTKRGFIGKRQT